MGNMVFPLNRLLSNLTLVLGGVDFTGAKLHLYSNDLTPSPTTVVGDFTECIFTGYAAASLVWSAPFYDVHGVAVSTPGEKLFAQTGATGDTCFGAYVTDTAGTKLLAAGRLADAPFTFAASGDALPINVKVGLDQGVIVTSVVP